MRQSRSEAIDEGEELQASKDESPIWDGIAELRSEGLMKAGVLDVRDRQATACGIRKEAMAVGLELGAQDPDQAPVSNEIFEVHGHAVFGSEEADARDMHVEILASWNIIRMRGG